MKKLFLSITLLLCLTASQSQSISKRENVIEVRQMGNLICSLTAYRRYEADTLNRINMVFIGFDHAYPLTREFISLYSGSPSDFEMFLTEIIKFFEQDPGTSSDIGDTHISMEKATARAGGKMIRIHDNRVSYTYLSLEQVQKVKDAFIQWKPLK